MKDVEGFNNFASQIDIDVPLLRAAVEVNKQMYALAEEGVVPHATDERPLELNMLPSHGIEKIIENLKKIKA